MSLTTFRLPILALVLGGILAACSAKEIPPIIGERQEHLKQIAGSNRAIRDELEKPEPSVDLIRTNAATMAELVPQLPTWFPEGSGPETGADTEALPIIWEQPELFAEKAGNAKSAVENLMAAASGGDLEQIRTAAKDVGPNCGGCHDTFRMDD